MAGLHGFLEHNGYQRMKRRKEISLMNNKNAKMCTSVRGLMTNINRDTLNLKILWEMHLKMLNDSLEIQDWDARE